MDSFFFRIKVFFKVFFSYLFYFPGLVLHEGSHAVAALITLSQIRRIKLFPSIKFANDDSSYHVTYGYVESIASYRVAYVLIGLAPFTLWLIPVFIASHFEWINISTLTINWSGILHFKNWWFLFLMSQIIWAGFPSSQDWKVVAHGLFSVSGAVMIVLASILYYIPNLHISSLLLGLL